MSQRNQDGSPALLAQLIEGSNPTVKDMYAHANPVGVVRNTLHNVHTTTGLQYGEVVESVPALGYCNVRLHNSNRIITCGVLTATSNMLGGQGIHTHALPFEGTPVYIVNHAGSSQGWIVGTCTGRFTQSPSRLPIDSDPGRAPIAVDSGAGVLSERMYTERIDDSNIVDKSIYTRNAPLDVLPGMYAVLGERRVGTIHGLASFTAQAGQLAAIRLCAFDDSIRIVSGNYQHYNAAGLTRILNDGGLVSTYHGVTPYQWEQMGAKDLDIDLFIDEPKAKGPSDMDATSLEPIKERTVSRKRLQVYSGYLGDIINMFIAKPDPDVDIETLDTKSKDQGLMHLHMDTSGRVSLKTAGGIMLERKDRIPVPKRLKEPWDPEGDIMHDTKPNTKRWFKYDANHPRGAHLQSRDAEAWNDAMAYRRLHDQSEQGDGKDFYLPEEAELLRPNDDYDEFGDGNANYTDYDLRRACIGIQPDGSILLRDAWGSEIVMAGGNIMFNASCNIEVRSGKSTVVLAGHDAVVKARQSIDILASERDVRIKADRNLHMLSEARNGAGGVLIESKSKGLPKFDNPGELANSTGVIIKSEDSQVLLRGKATVVSGNSIYVDARDNDDKQAGTITLSGDNVNVYGKTAATMSGGEGRSLINLTRSANILGANVNIIGDTGASIIRGSSALQGTWVSIDGKPPYTENIPKAVEEAKKLNDGDYIKHYLPSVISGMKFTYRSAQECGTVNSDGTPYAIYQPFWVIMKAAGWRLLDTVITDTWDDASEIDGTVPWPGDSTAQCYVKLDSELNIDPSTGLSKPRNEVINSDGEGPGFTATEFKGYEVALHV